MIKHTTYAEVSEYYRNDYLIDPHAKPVQITKKLQHVVFAFCIVVFLATMLVNNQAITTTTLAIALIAAYLPANLFFTIYQMVTDNKEWCVEELAIKAVVTVAVLSFVDFATITTQLALF